MVRRFLLLSCLAVSSALCCTPALKAQTSTVTPRITGPITDTLLTTLKGNQSVLARPEFDKGRAAPTTQLTNMRLVLMRSKDQQAALDAYMAQQLEKNSPNYHKWLTPQQLGTVYGPADSDVAAIVAWLQSHSFKVEPVDASRLSIAFSGSVAQVEEAFHTQIHSYDARGRQFYSNASAPRIPTALIPVVLGIAHLNTLEPLAHNIPTGTGTYNAEARRMMPANSSGISPRPDLTTGGALYIVPADAATIYDTPNMYNANFSSGTSYTGAGVTIGIGGDNLILGPTVVDFRTRFLNGDTTAPTISNVGGTAVTGNNTDEAYIDNELAGGMAPGAAIHFYTASDLISAINQAIEDNSVDIFSLSFGECELNLPTADNVLLNNMWQSAAGDGIAVTVSTGDNGSAGCDNQNSSTAAIDGLQVSGFASTPWNIAVGGTDFYGLINGFSTYVNTNSGSSNFYRSALSYIPESTWNDSVTADGLLANNVAAVGVIQTGQTDIVGGSGGVSACSANTSTNITDGTCTSGYAKPSWQRGTGVPNDKARDLPDVSLMAGNGVDGAAWLVCTDDQGTVGAITVTANCADQSDKNFYFQGFGGTSTSAPAFAGILALVQQKMGGGGQAHRLGAEGAKTLYDIFNGPNAGTAFHDITQGNNSVVCTTGTPNCSLNAATNYFLTGYDTGVGFDMATGLGSVDATALIKAWSSSIGSGAATVTATPILATITTTQSDTVNVTVGGSGSLGTPTGTVVLSGGGYTSSSATLNAGAASFTIPAGSLAAASDTITVTYNGDTNYASTTGTTTIVVGVTIPTMSATPSSATFPSNTAITVKATVNGGAGNPTPTGTVSLTGGGYTASAQALVNGSYTFNVPASSFTITGNDTLTVTYSGDPVYSGDTATASVDVTAPVLTATVKVVPASSAITVIQTLNVTGTVTGSGATPTGTVTLTSGTYTSGTLNLSSGNYSVTIAAGVLAAGSDTLTASYSGDTNYAANTGTGSVTVSQLSATVTATPANSGTFLTSQSEAVTLTVNGSGPAPTGSVSLTGGGYTSSASPLVAGSATITIPANAISTTGATTLTVNYTGDPIYAAGSGTASVTVNPPYTMASSTPAGVTPGTSATATITLTADPTYSGSVALTCALATSPSGAQDLPGCSVTAGSPVTVTAGVASGTATVTITTTAPTSANLERKGLPGWTGAGGGAVLALLVFLGIPSRRRSWRNLIGMVVVLAALGALSACGGGGGTGTCSGASCPAQNPGTTPGAYTFTVTGTPTPAITPAPKATVNLTVN